MYGFTDPSKFQIRNRDDFDRYVRCVLGGRESLGDLIVTENDSPELADLKRARVRSIISNMCDHLGRP